MPELSTGDVLEIRLVLKDLKEQKENGGEKTGRHE